MEANCNPGKKADLRDQSPFGQLPANFTVFPQPGREYARDAQ